MLSPNYNNLEFSFDLTQGVAKSDLNNLANTMNFETECTPSQIYVKGFVNQATSITWIDLWVKLYQQYSFNIVHWPF